MTSQDSAARALGDLQKRSLVPRAVARLLRHRLRDIECGAVTITLPGGVAVHRQGAQPGPHARLRVLRWRGLLQLAIGGELGLARAYMDGDIACDDIKAAIDFGAANETALARVTAPTVIANFWERVGHALRANTRRGSRRNIAAHYDLGNAFYARWLDSGMNYSAAHYSSPKQTLEEAQTNKLDRIVALLEMQPGQRVLEIGCGWGALAQRLLRQQISITGLTLSREQLAYARQRLSGVAAESVDLRLQDYRDVEGVFDRVASIEMFEAVGEKYWSAYFGKLRQSLTDTGIAVLQIITIAEERFASYRSRPDFIQRFVFPGGMLPTVSHIQREAERAGLQVVTHEEYAESYARTLSEWRRRFLQAWPEIQPLGFDERFRRLWEYYLAYCEAGFRTGAINLGVFKLMPRTSAPTGCP